MSEAILDANALIAAFLPQHVHNRRCRPFVEALDHFYTTPVTQSAFLRFLTRPWKNERQESQPPLMGPAAAMTLLRCIEACKAHTFLPDDVPFSAVSMISLSGHKQWTDAYLIALGRKHRLKLATLERKLDNMDDPKDPILWKVP